MTFEKGNDKIGMGRQKEKKPVYFRMLIFRKEGKIAMENFNFCVGTNILFGKGKEEQLSELLKKYGTRVLLTYGGGSIKRTGLYDKVKKLLEDFEVFELGGIEPNPRIDSVYEGATICREEDVDVILAVGGGSTIDCSKAIAAAAYYEGDAWDLILDSSKIEKALPICTILTLSATGSEMDNGGVITNLRTKEKLGFGHPLLLPKVSVLNPENTFSVPANQTAAGSADIMSHILEVYFDRKQAAVPDRISEGLLKTVIQYAPIAVKEPDNYEARAELMWTSSLAINGICSTGKECAWSCHPMEHELSAYYDITHGVGLAILTPRWMRYILNDDTVDKFAEYAVNVWNVVPAEDKYETANAGIDATEAFLKSLGIPMTLTELNIGEEHFARMAEHAVEFGGLNDAYVPLSREDVVNIYKMCL